MTTNVMLLSMALTLSVNGSRCILIISYLQANCKPSIDPAIICIQWPQECPHGRWQYWQVMTKSPSVLSVWGYHVRVAKGTSPGMNQLEEYSFLKKVQWVGAMTITTAKYDKVFGGVVHIPIFHFQLWMLQCLGKIGNVRILRVTYKKASIQGVWPLF